MAGFKSSLNMSALFSTVMGTHVVKLHVVFLQETLTESVAVPGYRSLAKHEGPLVGALVSEKLTHVTQDLQMASSKIEYIMIEIIPGRVTRGSTFILNVYSSPNDLRQRFTTLVCRAAQLARESPLLIAGDFNAPYRTWGNPYDTHMGEYLWREALNRDLMLVTDPSFPTRCGTSTSRDTTPDLTYVRGAAEAKWANLNIDLGSDHYILAKALRVEQRRLLKFRVTDWDKFGKIREEYALYIYNATAGGLVRITVTSPSPRGTTCVE